MFNIMNVVKPSAKIQMIHHSQIHTNDRNFYEMSELEQLKEDIAEHGVRKNLEIYPSPRTDGMYELVDGERRFTAITQLIKEGRNDLEYIPCLIDEAMSKEAAEKRLILANATTRVISPKERLKQIERLKILYKKEKEEGKLPGRIQHLIAEDLGLKKSQVGNYEKILNHAIPEVKQMIESGEITINAAAELSSLEDEDQLMFIDTGNSLDIKTIKEYKDELSTPKKEEEEDQVYVEEREYIDNHKEELPKIDPTPKEAPKETIASLFNEMDRYAARLLTKFSLVEFREEKKEFLEILEKIEILKYRLGIVEE